MIEEILEMLGLKFNPSKHVLKPPRKKVQTKTETRQKESVDNIVYSSGRAFIQTDKADGFEADIYTDKAQTRTGQLTQTEIDTIQDKGLDIDKAAEIKYIWATGATAKEAATEINRKGFRLRTIQKYYSVFNE